MRRLVVALCAALALPACADGARDRQDAPPFPFGALPPGWPSTFAIGLRDVTPHPPPVASDGFRMRYVYLSGGANTGQGWRGWGRGGGSFVADYLAGARAAGMIPVFSYYQLLQSEPGRSGGEGEAARDAANLRNPATMRAYYDDLEAFFRAATSVEDGAAGAPVVLHMEPDLWGYAQTLSRNDRASTLPVSVRSTGRADLRGLSNDFRGFAQAVLRLRNRYAPRVLVAYHLSAFGSGKDIRLSHPTDREIDVAARRSARFYASLGARFDLLFAEFANRDDGYSRVLKNDGGEARWNAQTFRHHARYLAGVGRRVHRRTVLWQIPVGNRVMRSVDNTPGHFQDNRVEWLLGGGYRRRLAPYVNAGVIALLFGHALPQATCACDARGDGVTNPEPIGSNRRTATSADDDGGYLKERARVFAGTRPVRLSP